MLSPELATLRSCKADAGLNAIPLLEEYRAAPEGNIHLLLTGMGAVAGQLTNIDLRGQPSMAFHGDPALMRHDPYRSRSHTPNLSLGVYNDSHILRLKFVQRR